MSEKRAETIIGYARVSTAGQAENGHGLDAQVAAIRLECQRRGWTLCDIVRDEGESGGSLHRPGLREALERIAAGEATGLVVSKLDRVTRSVADLGVLLEWAEEAGATLVALDLGLDTSSPGGRLVANVFAAVGEWERDIAAQRTREGLVAARSNGRTISRPAVADQPELVSGSPGCALAA